MPQRIALLTAVLATLQTIHGFYLPGVHPHSFKEGDP
jgi:hypothetical protein